VVLAVSWLAAVVVLGGVTLVLNRMGHPATASSTRQTVVRHEFAASTTDRVVAVLCPVVDNGGPGAAPGDVCQRVSEDFIRRSPLTSTQTAQVTARATTVDQLLHQWPTPSPSCLSYPGPCALVYPMPGPTELAWAKAALVSAGFTAVVVRFARADDPAPAGALLVAVAAGPGCVIGLRDGRQAWQTRIGGSFPDGSCLPS
jgi:hypothetical protein